MGTKSEPGRFNCFEAALPDEPVFVLLGRDTQAPGLLHMWAFERAQGIAEGRFPESDLAKVHEAQRLASQMIDWRQRNDGAWRAKNPELPLVPASFAHECAATGQSCRPGPHGPRGETQCEYCGAAPAQEPFAPDAVAERAKIREACFCDALGGRVEKPRLFSPDFELYPGAQKPRTADTSDAARAMTASPFYPED